MYCKIFLLAAIVACLGQNVFAKEAVPETRLFKEIGQDLVKPVIGTFLNVVGGLFLPKNYNFDSEIEKYIGIISNIAINIREMFDKFINMMKSARTKNRPPGAMLNPRVYDDGVGFVRAGAELGKHIIQLVLELISTVKFFFIYFAKQGVTFIPRKIKGFLFGESFY